MKINISNYEIFALDYLEGNLEAEEMAAMQNFLQAHPKIAIELEVLKEMAYLVPDESIVFVPKRKLLKTRRLGIIWSNQQVWVTLGSAAALVVLIFTAYLLCYSDTQEASSPVAQTPAEHIDTIKNTQKALEMATNTLNVTATEEQEKDNKSIKRQNIKNGLSDKEIKKSGIAKRPTHIIPLPKNKEDDKIDIAETAVPTSMKVAIAELPKKKFSLLSIAHNQVIKEQQLAIALHDSRKNNRFELDKVKQYLAKLPFEDLTVAHFIPSYFLDNQKGKNLF